MKRTVALVAVWALGFGLSCGSKSPQDGPTGAKGLDGWTTETKRVTVATPEGKQEKEITYYTNSIGMTLVKIPAGEFMMGSDDSAEEVARKGNISGMRGEWFQNEFPQHKVRITKSFYMGACEVTQEQYKNVMGQKPPGFGEGDHPIQNMSWNDATKFCRRLSQKDGVEYRLPTEAEWEYACRAGTTTAFYTGGTITTDQANYNGMLSYGDGPKGEFRQRTTPVGSFLANAFGLFDMHGNVWEWCRDGYDEKYYANSPSEDPKGPDSASVRVVRGGSWTSPPYEMRSANRCGGYKPADKNDDFGFRVVVGAQE